MIKNLILASALLLASLTAQAAPPTPEQLTLMSHMVSECSGVMGREVCTVMIDSSKCKVKTSTPFKPQGGGNFAGGGAAGAYNESALPRSIDYDDCLRSQFREKYPNGILVAGAGRFTADEYFLYQGAGDRMCDVIVRQCSVDYDGRGCLMARALWRQR